jgi:hypothetical protein
MLDTLRFRKGFHGFSLVLPALFFTWKQVGAWWEVDWDLVNLDYQQQGHQSGRGCFTGNRCKYHERTPGIGLEGKWCQVSIIFLKVSLKFHVMNRAWEDPGSHRLGFSWHGTIGDFHKKSGSGQFYNFHNSGGHDNVIKISIWRIFTQKHLTGYSTENRKGCGVLAAVFMISPRHQP